MKAEWKEFLVAEIAGKTPNSLVTGPFGSSISSRHFQSFGIPVIRGSNLSAKIDSRLIEDEYVFLAPEKAQEFSRSTARQGDLVFTCWGTIGQVGLIDKRARYKEYIISNKQMKLTPNGTIADSLFLYYLFSSPLVGDEIRTQAIGSSVPGFNLGQLKSIRLRLPPIGAQRRIAHILGTFDDKIELNRRTNETLEAMARAIFKSWFVDFDPVKAKAAGQRPFGMDDETAALFPSEFEDSELGPIPKGWSIYELQDVIELKYGKALKANERKDGNVPVFGSKGMIGTNDVSLVSGPGLIIGRKGWPGAVTFSDVDFFPIDTAFYVSRLKKLPWLFLYFALEELQLHKLGGDSAVPGLSRDVAIRQKVVIPNLQRLTDAFNTLAVQMRELVFKNELMSQTLAQTRDLLLPRLLSGELEVPV